MNVSKRLNYIKLDTISLSIFRIALGISWLYNIVLYKLPSLPLFWGDNAIPSYSSFKLINGVQSFSIFDIFKSTAFAYIVFTFTIILLLLFIIGYKTKFTGWLLYFFLFNIHQRISPIIFGFDFFSLQLLFFALFLPLDKHFTYKKSSFHSQSVKADWLPSIALLLQISLIYFSAGIAKYGDSWKQGYAVHVMLSDKMLAYSWASFFAENKIFYILLTYLTLFLELIIPLLIFLPIFNKYLRIFASISLFIFHLSIFCLYDVCNFSLTGFAVAILLFPVEFLPDFIKKPKLIEIKNIRLVTKFNILKNLFILVMLIWVLLQNSNFIYKNNYSTTEIKQNTINWIDKFKFGEAFISTQYWKMFAPNPPSKLGWITIEYLKNDGLMYDFFTDQIVTNIPIRNYKPIGMEKMFLSYARLWETRPKFQLYLSYWLKYHLSENKIKLNNNNFYLANYSYYYSNNEIHFTKQLISSNKILNGIK